jgi:hypothetical protein
MPTGTFDVLATDGSITATGNQVTVNSAPSPLARKEGSLASRASGCGAPDRDDSAHLPGGQRPRPGREAGDDAAEKGRGLLPADQLLQRQLQFPMCGLIAPPLATFAEMTFRNLRIEWRWDAANMAAFAEGSGTEFQSHDPAHLLRG